MEIEFIRMDTAFASEMHELEVMAFSTPWSMEQCEKAFKSPAFIAWGLRYKSKLVAFLSVFRVQDEMEIINFTVHAQYRKQGFGKLLLIKILQEAVKMGIQIIALEVREHNIAALSLYEKTGFVRCGERKGYYSDTGEDALLYQIAPSAARIKHTRADLVENFSKF